MKPSLIIMRQEWRLHRMSLISYTLGIWLIFLIFLFFFETFKANTQIIDELIKNFPPAFKAAFGLADVPLAQINGYLTFIFSYLVLVGGIFGMKLGICALSEEGRTKTSDFLLTRPIKRSTIVTSKLLAMISLILMQSCILTIGMYLPLLLFSFENLDDNIFLLLSGSLPLIQVFFVGIGTLLAASLKRIKNPMPMTLGIVFFFFIVESINQSLIDKGLEYLTPFAYFNGSQLLRTGSYEIKFLIIDFVVFIVMIAASYWVYCNKDVHAV